MAFDSISELLYMQGHGGYVWAAYALTAVALFYNAIAPGMRRRRLARQLALQRARQRLAGAADAATAARETAAAGPRA